LITVPSFTADGISTPVRSQSVLSTTIARSKDRPSRPFSVCITVSDVGINLKLPGIGSAMNAVTSLPIS